MIKKTSSSAWHGRGMACLLLLCGGLAAPGLRGQEVSLIRGSFTNIAVPEGISNLVIGSNEIIAARPLPDGRAALVVGLVEGSSDLRIQPLKGPDVVYKVAVHSDPRGILGQIQELLGDVPGLEIKMVGAKVVLEGKIQTPVDLDKIKKVETAYPGVILDLAVLDQWEMATAIRNAILKDLHDIGVDSVGVQATADTAVLDGVVYSDLDMARAIQKAKLHVPNVTNLMGVQQVMIETDLQFVEVDRDKGASFGENLFDNNIVLAPTASLANTGRPGLMLGATATYKINAALTAANSKSIYQEHVSGASGQEVNFKQGRTIYAAGLAPIPYGVIIKVKPTLLGRGGIQTDLSVEVSTAVGGPGQVTTTEFRTATSVMSKVGQTVVLSGFAHALGTESYDKTPGLGEIPLLNLLFASKSRSKVHKEAVLLLTMVPSFPEAALGPAFSSKSKNVLNDAQGEYGPPLNSKSNGVTSGAQSK